MPTIMEKARTNLVLDHPFFASIIMRHPMEIDNSIGTIGINMRGRIRYNDEWFEKMTVKQAVYLLAHEALHYASMHPLRVGKREFKPWNFACDAWINDTLNKLGIGEMPQGGFVMPGAAESTPENLYDILMEDSPQGGKGKGKPGAGIAMPQPGQDPMEGDMEEDETAGMTDGEKAEIESNIKLEIAEAAQNAKMCGKLPGLLEKFVAATIDSKVPWFDVLERWCTEKIMNDYSWARPNRRYMPSHYMPTLNGIGAMGELVVQIDISGSVSRKEIGYYDGHMKRIIELCNPLKVHVLYTDTDVQHYDVFEQGEEVEITYHSGGGTDMRAGFTYLDKHGITPACVVTLTDGYTPFPTETDYPAIWCISSDTVSPTGETIPFKMEE
jgi:predicted metal-dependent peptidase